MPPAFCRLNQDIPDSPAEKSHRKIITAAKEQGKRTQKAGQDPEAG